MLSSAPVAAVKERYPTRVESASPVLISTKKPSVKTWILQPGKTSTGRLSSDSILHIVTLQAQAFQPF